MNRTEIANYALALIGVPRITDLTDGTKTANKISGLIVPSEEYVLRLHDWPSHTATQALALTVDTPLVGFAYRYSLPPNTRIIELVGGGAYRIEQQYLETDLNPVYCRYVLPATGDYSDPLLSEAIALHLAQRLAIDIADDQTKRAAIQQEFMMVMQQARSVASNEGTMADDTPGWWFP